MSDKSAKSNNCVKEINTIIKIVYIDFVNNVDPSNNVN